MPLDIPFVSRLRRRILLVLTLATSRITRKLPVDHGAIYAHRILAIIHNGGVTALISGPEHAVKDLSMVDDTLILNDLQGFIGRLVDLSDLRQPCPVVHRQQLGEVGVLEN